jgi:hypothetical protein
MEDGEIIWGIGEPVSLSEIPSDYQTRHCPNCSASLDEFATVLVNIVFKESECQRQAA